MSDSGRELPVIAAQMLVSVEAPLELRIVARVKSSLPSLFGCRHVVQRWETWERGSVSAPGLRVAASTSTARLTEVLPCDEDPLASQLAIFPPAYSKRSI